MITLILNIHIVLCFQFIIIDCEKGGVLNIKKGKINWEFKDKNRGGNAHTTFSFRDNQGKTVA